MKQLHFYCFNGEVITPDSPDYEKARQEWNRSIEKYPLAIAYCNQATDVSEAIRWARKEHVEIRIRSGGHNYEGYSTGNRVIIIDVSHMKGIRIDEKEGTVTVEGGVRNRELYAAISSRDYPFPGGICPTVGVSGYCLGGGWGYSARYLGLGCDSLLALKLVNAEGCILTATEKINSDLFWACRGAGGGNFGVVVAMTFRLPPKVKRVVSIEMYYPEATQDMMTRFLMIWQQWIDTVAPTINMNGGLYHTAKEGKYIYARGICYGDVLETQALLAPFYQIEGADIVTTEETFLEAIERFAATYPDSEKFKSTGRFANEYLSKTELQEIVGIVNQPLPKGALLTSVNVYGLGGKVQEVGPFETAFFYRDAKYILSLQAVWEDNNYKKDNVQWVQKYFPTIYGVTVGSYVNFPYGQLMDYEEEYYGENVPYLRSVKEKYDPCNVFCFKQSIN